jgi:ATP-dependent Clp protease ATP-binding subunit ClpX
MEEGNEPPESPIDKILKMLKDNPRIQMIQPFMNEEKESPTKREILDLRDLNPRNIKERLDAYVIGQEKAKKIIAVAAYKHILRIRADIKEGHVSPVKNNVILIGSTGTGKTYICQKLAEILNLPFAIIDASSITQSGYQGGSINEFAYTLKSLAAEGLGASEGAKYGIVMIDEIDKLVGDSDNVGKVPVQQELLKIIEGREVAGVDTSNILFIGAGAFENKIVEGKAEITKSMGFGGEDNATLISVNDQLVDFGLMPELVGRFQVGTCLEDLSSDDLKTILLKGKESVLKNTVEVFNQEGVKLSFTKGALDTVVSIAQAKGTGARALNSMLEQILTDLQFDLFGKKNKGTVVKINKHTINNIVL